MIKESPQKFENKETFDLDEFLSNNQFNNLQLFERFLKDLFRELSNAKGGISLETFNEFINLPSYIADKIFKVFDKNNSKNLASKTFINEMLKLYNGDFQTLTKFIFDFYDFDKDGNILFEDVNQIQLLILPSQHHSEEVFKLIKESLDTFFDESKLMSYQNFLQTTENINSDIFMNLLIYLYTNKPFSNEIINYYNSDKRVGEESNLITSENMTKNKMQTNFQFGLKKMNIECNSQEKVKIQSISKEYKPLFQLNPKDIVNNKLNDNINEDFNINCNNSNRKSSIQNSKLRLSSINNFDVNNISNRDSANVFYINDGPYNYTNLDNVESFSSDKFPSPKFADNKQNKNSINSSINDDPQNKQIQNNSRSNSRLYFTSVENFFENNINNNNINNINFSSNKNSKGDLKSNNTKMKIKPPKNNLYTKGIGQNFYRMLTYSDAQHFQDLQGTIKGEAGDGNEENDLNYDDEYEDFCEPSTDERTEIHDMIVVPQLPSIRNLFDIFRKMLSKRSETDEPNLIIANKKSLTEDDIKVIFLN
jgi:hypothetical protein